MNLSQKIKQLREEKGFSLGKLAETAEVSKAYLSQLENNVSKQPSAEILFRIASALGTTIADLLDKTRACLCERLPPRDARGITHID